MDRFVRYINVLINYCYCCRITMLPYIHSDMCIWLIYQYHVRMYIAMCRFFVITFFQLCHYSLSFFSFLCSRSTFFSAYIAFFYKKKIKIKNTHTKRTARLATFRKSKCICIQPQTNTYTQSHHFEPISKANRLELCEKGWRR